VDLVADRFVVARDRPAIDLASGTDVTLIVSASGDSAEQQRWALRCDWFFTTRHRGIAPLVDFGAIGGTQRFEVWQCGGYWRGSRGEAVAVSTRVARFLRATSRSVGSIDDGSVYARSGRPVVIPDAACGFEETGVASNGDLDVDHCGIQWIGRRAIGAIAEAFDEASRTQRVIRLSAPAGSGVTLELMHLARAARIAGFVPLAVDFDRLPVRSLLERRSLCLIGDRLRDGSAWSALIGWVLASPRPHVLIVAHDNESPGTSSIRLEPLDANALKAAVVPINPPSVVHRRIAEAARRSRGLPARFDALLWGQTSLAVGRSRRHLAIAAERPRIYGDETPEEVRKVDAPEWPAPGELAALRRKMEHAVADLAAGRHQPGERALRSTTAGLARRRDWRFAMIGAMALSASLLRRGRARDAQGAIGEAGEYGRSGRHDLELIDVSILSGVAWIDLGRLDEAESVLSASLGASESIGDSARAASSRLGLARALFWRARYEEAHRVLEAIEPGELAGNVAVRHAVACARVAIGRQDLQEAMTRAAAGLELAERSNEASLRAIAHGGMALVHLAIGDRAAVDADVAASVAAARAARDPLRALRARLLGAENARRAGEIREGDAFVARINKLPPTSLPLIVRARALLLADLLTASGNPGSRVIARARERADSGEIVKRHVAATGLPALALYGPPAVGQSSTHQAARDVVDLVRLCQSPDEDRAVLTRICALIRERVSAASVACFISDGPVLVPVAIEGSNRLEPEIARRAIDAGQLIGPQIADHHLVASAPIRCGADTHGALFVRWTLGSSPDLGRASMLLTTAAAAAAPAVAGLVARRSTAHLHLVGELVGPSAAMESVRRAVERAAAAPFAVLVEAESGCGKELVARALHRRSPRRDRPFCTLNCAALPDDLVEAELFGHARGAFTGASAERPGVFEEAHTGTLFLDEIGELSVRAQAKVLRTIQDGELRRLGENISRRVDVRIVSATNRDLRQETAQGRFRHDLLYRLDVVRIGIPPLRERRDDIPPLVERFWREAIERVGSRAALGVATVAALARYDWPGNVRELQNVLAALAVRGPRRGVIPPSALPPQFGTGEPDRACRLEEARRSFEQHFIRAALVRTGGHRERAAEELGVSRQGLTKLMLRLGISD